MLKLKKDGKVYEAEGVKYMEVQDFAASPYAVDPAILAVVVDYKNDKLIGDSVAPRILSGKSAFRYRSFNKEDGFTIPETSSSRKGELNQLEFGGTIVDDSVKDYGLMAIVPQEDIDNASFGFNPLNHHAEKIKQLIDLDREKRVITMVSTGSNYDNTVALDGTAGKYKFNDATNGDPIKYILAAKDLCTGATPNKLILSLPVWTGLRQNPKVVSAVYKNPGTSGVVNLKDLADVLELDEILVFRAFSQTANKGQNKTYARLGGSFAALVALDNMGTTETIVSQFFTAQFGQPVAYSYPVNPGTFGLNGGQAIVVGERVKEVAPAKSFGYLWTTAV